LKIFKVEQKTGFSSSDSSLRIFDEQGRPFYFKLRKAKTIEFNLPKGIYQTKNNIQLRSAPVVFRIPALPRPDYHLATPERFKIEWGNNPHKCSVYLKEGKVVFDYSFKEYPKFVVKFILYHECGHYLYKGAIHGDTEENKARKEIRCDLFARKCMLEVGYNPSQVYHASKLSLSARNPRSNMLYNDSIKNLNYE
jgi:hypothetical protein